MLFFFYAYRSLLARIKANAITMLSIALFVGGGSLGLSYYLSFRGLLVTAPPENIIVVSKGASSEPESKVPLETARKVALLDGIKKLDNSPAAVRELVSRVFLGAAGSSHYDEPCVIRGIDDHSLNVHHATLLQGSAPEPGSLQVIIGRRVPEKYPHIKIGYDIHLPGGQGRVTGVFATDGGPFEDEVWTERAALELHLNTKASSSVTLVADNVAHVPEIVDKINTSKELDAQASTVAAFRADRAGLSTIARTVLVLLVLLSVVATFAIATTMNAAVLMRMPEFAAMAAIGIRRRALGRIVLIESTLLATTGALLGVLVGGLIASQIGAIKLGVPVTMTSSIPALMVGLGLGIVVGVIGGIIPSIQVRRLDILRALR
ncbi:MAG: macB6 [Myxococcales bacterium]|nr:macB6 [Myxococcales bacterium]